MSDEVLDLNEFLERVQDDKELLLELLDIFSDDYQKKRVQLEEAVNKNDSEQIKSVAHSLKGASGNISAKSMRESFMKLEQMGEKRDISQAGGVLKTVDQQFIALAKRMEEVKKQLK